jgi:sodium transport system ATP-binding protein
VIETRGLTKVYHSRKRGRITAVDALDLECRGGEVYALLGPNGAGKTTVLRILSTLIDPTSGSATVDGHDVATAKTAIRRLIGVVSYETGIYERMTPREIGYYVGRLNDIPDATIAQQLEYVFALLRMQEFADERTDDFSTGMKQKTVIMRALVTAPRILIFDEPTAGLDILTAKSVMDYIRLLRTDGKTILFSTHVLSEAEKLADRIGIIHRGRLIEQGTLADLQTRTGKTDLEDIFFAFVQE